MEGFHIWVDRPSVDRESIYTSDNGTTDPPTDLPGEATMIASFLPNRRR